MNNTDIINQLVNRVYIIVGVIVLFLVAYSLLKNMVNPDEALKGKESPVKMISNVIISIVLIAVIPQIFDFAMNFQNALLKQNTIGQIILGPNNIVGEGDNNNLISNGGFLMAETVFKAFFTPNTDAGYCTGDEAIDASLGINGTCGYPTIDGEPYNEWWQNIRNANNFLLISTASDEVAEGSGGVITYRFVFSTIAGAFVIFVLLSYCIDIAIRMVKLAVYQLIAPLPILARILPQEQGKKVFSNWLKATISTYVEVFIRLAILYFAVLMINLVITNLGSIFAPVLQNWGNVNPVILLLTQALVVLGIILFMKQAPSIIKEITGLDGGKYNVLKSAKQGLALVGGGIAGRTPAAAIRAWEATGKDGSLKSIGNQYSRYLTKKLAKDEGAKWSDRTIDKARSYIGLGTRQQVADKRFEHNRDMKNKYFYVNNDTTSDINLRDMDGTIKKVLLNIGNTEEYNEQFVQQLNEAKSNNALVLSKISQEAKALQTINDVNKKVNVKGKMEDIAKGEMSKGKYYLRDENGNNLSVKFQGKIIGENENWTRKQWEDWFAANKEKMTDEEVTEISDKIDKSINDYTVTHFVNHNGSYNGELNADILQEKRLLAQQLMLDGVLDENGNKQSKITVDGKVIDLDTLSNNAVSITFSDVKKIKKYVVESVGNNIDQELQKINHEKVNIESENTAIDRMHSQVKERIEAEKSSEAYVARKAAASANNIEKSGKNG